MPAAVLGTILLAGTAAAAPSPAPTAAVGSVTFGVEPASATGPDGRPALSYGTTAGASVRDHVAILNYSTKPLRLSVYATDALNTTDGGFGLLPGGQRPTDAGAWTSLDLPSPSVLVPARTTARPGVLVVPLVVRVPRDAAPGDHVAGVVAALSTTSRSANGADVTLDQRIATRLFIRVSGKLTPQLEVSDVTATYNGTANPFGSGSVTVTYEVRNTGNVKLGGRQDVRVSGVISSAGPAAALPPVPLLVPGGSERVTVEIPGVLPQVRVQVRLTVVPVRSTGNVDPSLSAQTTTVGVWAVPWALLALLALLALTGYAAWRRSRRVTPTGDDAEPLTAGAGASS